MARLSTLDDPITFAHDVWGSMAAAEEDLCNLAPREYDAFSAALRRVEELIPPDSDAALRQAVDALSDAAHTWGTSAHSAGVTFGAAAEQLRRAILVPQR